MSPAVGESTSFRCQAIASPSRSGSLARYISSQSFTAPFSSATTFFLPSDISYVGVNVQPPAPSGTIFIAPLSLGRSRMCPIEEVTSKSFPKNFSMVLALAGDSTITRFLLIRQKLNF